jgi:hypothetical protein
MTNPPNGEEQPVEQGERLAGAAVAALIEFQRHVDRLGLSGDVGPAKPYPTLDDDYRLAMARHEAADAALDDWTTRWWAVLSPEEQRRVTAARQAPDDQA